MCHDLRRHYKSKTSPRCLMKIDIRKAYDMVQWEFVKEMLEGYGFPSKMVQLIMACVTTTSYSVRVNGKGYIWIFWRKKKLEARGFYLSFTIRPCNGILNQSVVSNGKTTKFQIPSNVQNTGIESSHLCRSFDDILKRRRRFCKRIMEALQHFSKTTGLEANNNKSSLLVAGVTENIKEKLWNYRICNRFAPYQIFGFAPIIQKVE